MLAEAIKNTVRRFIAGLRGVRSKIPYLQVPQFKTSNERMVFWTPLLLPFLTGLVVAFAELGPEIGRITGHPKFSFGLDSRLAAVLSFLDEITGAFLTLLLSSAKGIVVSMLTVDIWALSTVFSTRPARNDTMSHVFPILGVLVHFILMLFAVSMADGVTEFRNGYDDSGHLHTAAVLSMGLPLLVTVLFAMYCAWLVRLAVWTHHESMPDGQNTATGEPSEAH